MQKTDALETSVSQGIAATKTKLDFGEYAPHYDKMCEVIPVYEDNIQILLDQLRSFELPSNPRICDLGAGTGNYICRLHQALPSAEYTHVDFDPVMNKFARQKYAQKGIKNVAFVEDYMQRLDFDAEAFDMIVSINSLNTAPPQQLMLRNICKWLKPGGYFFLIDFGRKQSVVDWTYYIAKNLLKEKGLITTVKTAYQTRKAIVANSRGRKEQSAGKIWTHSTDELLGLFDDLDFEPLHSQQCYRGYCDLVVSRKYLSNTSEVSLQISAG